LELNKLKESLVKNQAELEQTNQLVQQKELEYTTKNSELERKNEELTVLNEEQKKIIDEITNTNMKINENLKAAEQKNNVLQEELVNKQKEFETRSNALFEEYNKNLATATTEMAAQLTSDFELQKTELANQLSEVVTKLVELEKQNATNLETIKAMTEENNELKNKLQTMEEVNRVQLEEKDAIIGELQTKLDESFNLQNAELREKTNELEMAKREKENLEKKLKESEELGNETAIFAANELKEAQEELDKLITALEEARGKIA
jgi:exonuclease SbcC